MPSFRIISFAVLSIAVLPCLLSRAAIAADTTLVGVLSVASDPEVTKELGLSDEVREKLAKLIDQREGEALELSYSTKESPAAERDAKFRAFRDESEQLGLKLLSDAQQRQLEQIH